MIAVFKREFKAYFTSAIGYVTLLVLFFLTGFLFSQMYASGYPYIDYLFSNSAIVAAFIIPVITMRLFSEERKNKTDQALFCAPVKLWEIVLGKFFAALALFAIGFAPTLIYQFIISCMVSTNWLHYIICYIGILLFGGALIAIGCFISSLTESQAVAAIMGLAATIVVMLADTLASMISVSWLSGITSAISEHSFLQMLTNFTMGIISPASIIYFVSFIALFIFFTVLSLNKRRWK